MEKANKSAALGVRQLPLAGILTALVIVLQMIANYIQLVPSVSITLTLVPIVIGAALLGPYIGMWLGFVFGILALVAPSTAAFLSINAPATVAICLIKGICAGLVVGIVYRLLESKNRYLAIMCSAVACPVTNTGIFLLGCRLFFWPAMQEWAVANGFTNAAAFMFLGLAGINFVVELAINLVLAPVILRLIDVGKKMRS